MRRTDDLRHAALGAALALVTTALACDAPSGKTEIVSGVDTSTATTAPRIPPTMDPLPAVAFPLRVVLPLPKESGCDPKKARLEITEVSSARDPARDPKAAGRHTVRAGFVSSGSGCCPPTIEITDDGGAHVGSLTMASWDVPAGVICERGGATALIAIGSPSGTRALRFSALGDSDTETIARVDLETGKVDQTTQRVRP